MPDTMTSSGPQRTHRFALCLSGGIALGTYMAGALAQLYRDFHVFNAAQDRLRLEIDAFAGSSAGSMTGLILAQTVAFDPDPEGFAERMWQCWVTESDILSLLQPANNKDESLLTDECVQAIAKKTIQQPTQTDGFDPRRALALWMTMTNLDGIPYCVNFKRPGADQAAIQFYALSYRDYAPYFLCGNTVRYVSIPLEALCEADPAAYFAQHDPARRPELPDGNSIPGYAPEVSAKPEDNWWWYSRQSAWCEVREHAITSGAFPLAFRSRSIPRDLTLYPEYQVFKEDTEVQKMLGGRRLRDEMTAQCVDGGIFNNQPIGRAIDAVSYLEKLDPARCPDNVSTFRTYLVIEPDPTTAQQVASLVEGQEKTQGKKDGWQGMPPASVLAKIISAYFNDALYSDFQKAEETNEKLKTLDGLADAGRPNALTPGQLHAVKVALRLDYKRPITLEHIPYSPVLRDRLAGDFAGHFGGFLQENLRAHDYLAGQYEARQWFLKWLQAHAADLHFDVSLLTQEPAAPVFTHSSLANPPDPETVLSGLLKMKWSDLDKDRRAEIVEKGAARMEIMAGHWIEETQPYLPAVRALLTPKAQEILLRSPEAPPVPPAPLDWHGALHALNDTPTVGPLFHRVRGVLRRAAWALVLLAILAGIGVGAIPAAYLHAHFRLLMGSGGILGGLLAWLGVRKLLSAYVDPYLP